LAFIGWRRLNGGCPDFFCNPLGIWRWLKVSIPIQPFSLGWAAFPPLTLGISTVFILCAWI